MRRFKLCTLLGVWVGIAHAQPNSPLSDDALRKCADAAVAECQHRLAEVLERGSALDVNRAKALYEAAYAGGYKPAGDALLRLVANSSRLGSDEQATTHFGAIEPSTGTAAPSSRAVIPFRGDAVACISSVDGGVCEVEVRAVPGALDEDRLLIGLYVTNRRATRLYVSRGLTRAFQDGSQLRLLQKSESSSWARLGGVARALLDLAPVGGRFGKEAVIIPRSAADLSRNALTMAKAGAKDKVVSKVPLASGRPDYFTSGYVEAGELFSAVFLVQVQSKTTDVVVEIELDGQKASLVVNPAEAQAR